MNATIEPETGFSTSWMDLLQRHGPKKMASHAAVGFAAYQLASPLVKKAQAWNKERTTYTITVNGTDGVYDDVHEWVLLTIPNENRKALVASTGGGYDGTEPALIAASWSGIPHDGGSKYTAAPAPPKPKKKFVRLRYDGSRTHKVRVKGHQVAVGLLRDEVKTNWNELPHNWRRQLERVVFTVHSAAARDAVVDLLEELAAAKRGTDDIPQPPLYISDRWGSGWDRRDDLPRRSLDSVILPETQLAELVTDLGTFLASESEYNRRTLPWHRGYLFHGPPGTGKTSVVKALAEHFHLPLYYLPLGDLRSDSDLMSLISQVATRSILLLEDVDVFHAARERDDGDGVTLSALLNALDGVWTPHGLVTFMTTNHRDVLDDAVLRPGRVDREVELRNLTEEQARRMVEWFFGSSHPDVGVFPREWVGHSPAELLQHMTIRAGIVAG